MRKYIQDILDLRATADFNKTKAVISSGITLRGYNMWILLCAAILASIGLDTNSVAIIIGAMLISPSMPPILGVGLSVAIHDRLLLGRSLRNLSVHRYAFQRMADDSRQRRRYRYDPGRVLQTCREGI